MLRQTGIRGQQAVQQLAPGRRVAEQGMAREEPIDAAALLLHPVEQDAAYHETLLDMQTIVGQF
jgi:hypothetical protein